MKKSIVWIFILILVFSLTACGQTSPKGEITTDVTWDELLKANQLDAVFKQVDSFSSTEEDDEGETYIHNVAMVDNELIYSSGTPEHTEDLRNGILYDAPKDGLEKSITIIAPTADLNDLIEDFYGESLDYYQVPSDIYVNEGQYFAKLYQESEESGVVVEGYAYFDTETLLLDRVELVQKIGSIKYDMTAKITYNIGTDFAMPSYDNIINTDDVVDLTIHYPDKTTTDITVDRNVTISAYYPDHLEQWSVCYDEACTASVNDLGWIIGDHDDIYICEGEIAPAPPALNRVLEMSSFDTMFKNNYNTYFQNTQVMDKNNTITQTKDLAWYMDEAAGLCLNFEIKDADYNVIQSGRARENAWYSWTKETGYAVDFFDNFTYAEDLVKDHRLFILEEQLCAPIKMGEEGYAYYIPYEETINGAIINEYKYWIHPDSDYIERVEITNNDGFVTCYINGNGPIPGDMDIFAEISEPSDAKAVTLTVVSSTGEKTYAIRNDAKISWKGEALYSDKDLTTAVTDLSWVDGNNAKVYVK